MQAQTSSSSGVTTGGPDSDVASVDELPVDDKNKGKTLNSQKMQFEKNARRNEHSISHIRRRNKKKVRRSSNLKIQDR